MPGTYRSVGWPARARIRCNAPLYRLMRHPIRCSAANARFALTDGHFRFELSGGNEGHVHGPGHRLATLQAIRDKSHSQRLHRGRGPFSRAPVSPSAGQGRNVSQPAAVLRAIVVDGQREPYRRPFYDVIMPRSDAALLRFPMPAPSAPSPGREAAPLFRIRTCARPRACAPPTRR